MLEEMRKSAAKRKIVTAAVIFLCIVLAAKIVYAAVDTNWYVNNKDILSQNSIIKSALRWIEWSIIKLAVYLCNATQNLYNTAFNFIDITEDETIVSYMETFRPVVIALMALSLLYLGIILLVEHEKKPKLMINICIVILCVTSSSLIFETLNEWTISFKDAIGGDQTTVNAYGIINNNISDLVYLEGKYSDSGGLKGVNWSANEDWGSSLVNEADFWEIDFTEVLNYKTIKYDYSKETTELLKNYYYRQYKNGVWTAKTGTVKDGIGSNHADDDDFGNTFYFRYTLRFLPVIIQLCALIIIYITMAYKVIRCIFELVVARLFAYLYSAELSGGEKIKKILVFIRDSYILLVVTSLCIKVYLLLNVILDDRISDPLVTAFFSLFLAFSVIDGPNLVEKLLGMDAGLKSSTARMLAIGRAASGLGRSAKGVAAGAAAAPKNIAQKANAVKSGKVSEGGLAAGAARAVFGKEVSNSDPGTHREGGLVNRMGGKNSSAGGSSAGSAPSGSSEGGSSAASPQKAAQGGSLGAAPNNKEASSGGAVFYSGAGANTSSAQKTQKGDKGDSGQKGEKGDRGSIGLAGNDGRSGEQGKEGRDGKDGKEGKDGKDGSQGRDARSFMDQGTKSTTVSDNGNNFMNGGGRNGDKNDNSKYRK